MAENTRDAEELIKWYRSNIDSSKVTWGIAENFRYLNSFDYAGGIAQKLGRVLNFRMRMATMLKGGKYYGNLTRVFISSCGTDIGSRNGVAQNSVTSGRLCA